ncbi:MAG: hypothetical protein J6B07_07725, partial [Opitutales bacterium]|nr:hypothetical protein [Opitutales bacterium]
MKKYRNKTRYAFVAAFCAGLAFMCSAFAADGSKMQEKINLMVSAVQAREAGDLQKAKSQLEELIKIAPEDSGVQRMLADVNSDIARQQKGEKTVLAPSKKVEAVVEEKAIAEAEKAEATIAAASEKQEKVAEGAVEMIAEAYDAMEDGDWEKANALMVQADAKLKSIPAVDGKEYSESISIARSEWNSVMAAMAKERAEIAMAERNPAEAKQYAQEYKKYEADPELAEDFIAEVEEFDTNPYNHTVGDANPSFAERQKRVESELRKARLQYLYGDYQGARITFRNIETLDATNVEAKAYQRLIAEKLKTSGKLSYMATRETMLGEIDDAWARPQVFSGNTDRSVEKKSDSETEGKLRDIIISNFDIPEPGITLAQALKTLSMLSEENDKSTSAKKGVNIVLFDEASQPENVNLSLRGESLGEILDILSRKYGYQYDIESEKIIVRKGSDQSTQSMDTVDFAVTQATVTRMVGLKSASSSGGGDVFGGGDSGEMSPEQQGQKIKDFLTRAGVEFGTGANVAFDGTKLWITNTARNLDKVRNILLKYSEVKQVEIEAKFLEVQQGDLKELAFNWRAGRTLQAARTLTKPFGLDLPVDEMLFQTTDGMSRNLRTVADGFPKVSSSGQIGVSVNKVKQATDAGGNTIFDQAGVPVYESDGTSTSYIEQPYPTLNSSMNVGVNSVPTSSAILGVISGYTVELLVNALEQKTGSDLLCAPKVTVISGSEARITVSQQMYYAESWGDMQSQVSSSSSS